MFNSDVDSKQNMKVFNGNWRGVVVDDQDPLTAGRVRVRVYGVYDGVPDGALPWALYCDPFMGGQGGLGGFWIPDVGSEVWVFFEQGNHMNPVYFGGAPSAQSFPDERRNGSYARNKVFRTKAGHSIELDDSVNGATVRIIHSSGSSDEMVDDGSRNVAVKKDLNIYVEGNADLYVRGDITETVEGNVSRSIQGDVTETVYGDFRTNVMGKRSEISAGGSEYGSVSTVDIGGSEVNINE